MYVFRLRRLFLVLASVLIFSLPNLAQEDPCWTFIQKLKMNKNSPAAQTQKEKNYFAFSGMKGQNDLGNRSGCESNYRTKYYVIGAITPAPAVLHSKSYIEHETGICVPDYCELASDESQLRELSQINNYNTELHLVLNDPNADPPRGEAYYILACLFCILVVFVITSTIIQSQAKIFKVFGEDQKNSPIPYHPHWIFKSFDMAATLKSLYSTAKESGQSDHLSMFGFIRVFSIFWIVAFHTLVIHRQINPLELTGSSNTVIEHFVRQGDLGPELFFVMAGFLAAFTLVGKATREGIGIRRFLTDLWHRFLRTYPGFIVSLIFFWIVMPGMMNGPLWNRYIGQVIVCEERWPQKFFLYGNFIQQPFNTCAAWSWYVFTDLHVYPLIILLAYMYASNKIPKKTTYAVACLLTIISFVIGIYLINMKSDISPVYRWYNFSPARAGQILIGVLFGFQYYEYSKLKQQSNFIAFCESNAHARYLSIMMGFALSAACIFVIKGDLWHFAKRYVMSVGVALIFMPLANDCSSIGKKIMNLRFFQVLGKLSFGVFLLHWTIILAVNYTDNSIPHVFNFTAVMYKSLKVAVYSVVTAIIYHLLFEKPLLNIENHFSNRKRLMPAQFTPYVLSENHVILPEVVTDDLSMANQSQDNPGTLDVRKTLDADSSPIE